MNMYLFDGPTDADEEIASMVKLKVEWELDVKFSKNGLIERIQ
jgi:hypothetical protein